MPRSFRSRPLTAVLAAIATAASALAISAPAVARQPANIEAVPDGQINALFYFNQRFIPEVAQSFILDSPTNVQAFTFHPAGVTRIEREYFDTPQLERHNLERFVTEYPLTHTDAVLTVWKAPTNGDLGTRFDIRDGFTQVAQVTTSFKLKVGQPNTIDFSPALKLNQGTYVVVLGMKFDDPNILTLHLAGRESGNNTRGGTRQELDSDCNYTRSSDSYPGGRAYKGSGSLPYTDSWDNYVGFGTEFLEHQAKIQECIAIGAFDTPFNPGDLKFTLVTAKSKGNQATSGTPTTTPTVAGNAPTVPPKIRKVTGKRKALTTTINPSKYTRALTHVVIAFTTPDKAGEAGRCTIKPGKKSCTIKGLTSGKTYYVTAGALWNNVDSALAPNRISARVR